MGSFLMYECFHALATGHTNAFEEVKFGGVMNNRLLSFVKKAVAPLALVTAMAAFSPMTAMAENRGGHEGGRGFSGGDSYAAPSRGNFGGDRAYSAPRGNVSGNFNRGYGGGRDFHGDRGYYGGRGYGPGFGFGVGVYPSYGYAAPVCNPAGFYDQYGVWHFYPGCAVPY
jgi:hypothetical protein